MKVGTMPLTVQVPEIAPIRNKMTMAVVTSPMLLLIVSSKSCHGTLNSHMASQMAGAEDGVAAEYADVQRQKRHENQDRNQGYSHPEHGYFLHLSKSVNIPFSKWNAS